MGVSVQCPTCGAQNLDLSSYDSMMVLTENYALFTLHCPHCQAEVSNVFAIPANLRSDVESAAMSLGCGMGRETSSF